MAKYLVLAQNLNINLSATSLIEMYIIVITARFL